MTTINPEHLEKMRQAVMRYRELLDIFQARLNAGDKAYQRLFDSISPEDKAQLAEKALQGKAAELLLNDPEPIKRAVSTLRFTGRDMEREFEALFDNLFIEAEEDTP